MPPIIHTTPKLDENTVQKIRNPAPTIHLWNKPSVQSVFKADKMRAIHAKGMNMKTLVLVSAILILCSIGTPMLAQDDPVVVAVGDNNRFAFDLYRQVSTVNEGNFVFSPFSVSLALAMTYNGAAGDTAAEMASTMQFTLDREVLSRTMASLTAQILLASNAEASEFEPERRLAIANALWGEQTFPFNAAFLAQLEADYGAGLQLVDFVQAAETAREQINTWIEEQTNGLIQDIVPQGAVTDLTRLVLANAIYFKSNWINQFSEALTQDQTFTLMDGSTVTVPMMRQEERSLYLVDNGYQAISLPYGGGLAMEIYMPDAGNFAAFEQTFIPDMMLMFRNSATLGEVALIMPRWETESDIPMTDLLQQMGMQLPFTSDADFSGMVDTTQTDEAIFITDVLHKAFISVDENGTEAAAATVVMMGATSAMPDPTQPFPFTIDRPFIYTIVDQTTGSVLFMGRVLDPSAS